MPDLIRTFQNEVDRAIALSRAGEAIRVKLMGDPMLGSEMSLFRLQLMYEMAFLHVFVHWEAFLEESFLRYLCGYQNSLGQQTTKAGAYYRGVSHARAALLGTRSYLLWHNPQTIQRRSQAFFVGGLHETVITSNFARMGWFAAIRHYTAHKHQDARDKFDDASMNLCGRRLRGSRPGALLRERAPGTTAAPQRWLEVISNELVSLGAQIVP